MINLEKYSQEQILRFYEELNKTEKNFLKKQINSINFDFMNELYKNSFFDDEIDISRIDSLKIIKNLSQKEKKEYFDIGEKVIKENKYAVVLLSGGFGSRLGLNIPKGCLKLKIKNKEISIFELFITQLKEIKEKYNITINLYIMTNTMNNKQITQFFETNNYFDYGKNNINFFSQENLPILDIKGKIVSEKKDKILFGPNGNGDVFRAMKKNNIISDMEKKGIKYVLFSNIDNVMSKMADLTFIGATIKNGYQLSSKTIKKNSAEEKDWIFCKYNNKPFMLPSAYIDENITNFKVDDDYVYREKNITYHLISINLINKFANSYLKYHRAYKKNIYLDENGEKIISDTPNSFKFEKFIFDAFSYADDMLLFRIDSEEFCPIKTPKDIVIAEEKIKKCLD